MAGTIVVLNGVAGVGKSTTARALQALEPEPFLYAGIDQFLRMLPARYLEAPLWLEVMGHHDRAGEVGERLVSTMHHALATMAANGTSVVADHVIVARHWLTECASLFAGLPAYLVGLHCPLDVLERRERERSDRQPTLGEAVKQFPIVHRWTAYDLELDTSTRSVAEVAQAIHDHIHRRPPLAFPLMALFEGAPGFVRRLLAEAPVGSVTEALDRALEVARALPEREQVELFDSHPRIGAPPARVSVLSHREQGYERDPGSSELQARLDRLNEAYEARFGFRFVVFVAGRPRPAMVPIMEAALGAERDAEKQRALADIIAIARNRAAKLGMAEEDG